MLSGNMMKVDVQCGARGFGRALEPGGQREGHGCQAKGMGPDSAGN